MTRELLGSVLVIGAVFALALVFAWLTRRQDRKRWARMTTEVSERRAKDDHNTSEVSRAKRSL